MSKQGPSTNPEGTARRVLRLKSALKVSWWDFSQLFGVRPLTAMRWGSAKFAPRLVHQRTLESLERKHQQKLDSLEEL